MPVLLPLLELACGLPVTHPWSRSGLYSREPVACSPRAIADWVASVCHEPSASSPSSPPATTAASTPSSPAAVSASACPIAEPPIPAARAHEPEPEPEHKPVTRGESGASSVAADEAEEADAAADSFTSAFELLRRELGLAPCADALAAAGEVASKREASGSLSNGEASLGLAGGRTGSERLSPLAEFLLLVDSYLVDNPANVAQVVHTRFFELLALLMHKVCCSISLRFSYHYARRHNQIYALVLRLMALNCDWSLHCECLGRVCYESYERYES